MSDYLLSEKTDKALSDAPESSSEIFDFRNEMLMRKMPDGHWQIVPSSEIKQAVEAWNTRPTANAELGSLPRDLQDILSAVDFDDPENLWENAASLHEAIERCLTALTTAPEPKLGSEAMKDYRRGYQAAIDDYLGPSTSTAEPTANAEQLIQGIKEIRKHAELSSLDCSILAWPLEVMALCDKALTTAPEPTEFDNREVMTSDEIETVLNLIESEQSPIIKKYMQRLIDNSQLLVMAIAKLRAEPQDRVSGSELLDHTMYAMDAADHKNEVVVTVDYLNRVAAALQQQESGK